MKIITANATRCGTLRDIVRFDRTTDPVMAAYEVPPESGQFFALAYPDTPHLLLHRMPAFIDAKYEVFFHLNTGALVFLNLDDRCRLPDSISLNVTF